MKSLLRKFKQFYPDLMAAVFAFLFTYTAIKKLTNIQRLHSVLEQNPFLGKYASILAWAIPMLEIMMVLILIIPGLRHLGLQLATILMALFTGYVVTMLITQKNLPCTCGGIIETLNWKQHAALNGTLTALGQLSVILDQKFKLGKYRDNQEKPNT